MRNKEVFACTAALTALAMFVAAPVASADSAGPESGIRIIAQEHTEYSGWVEYTGTGTVTIDGAAGGMGTQTVKRVGGGIWSYGSGPNAIGQKGCHSQYKHDQVSHGSSVEMDGRKDSDYVGAGAVSDARLVFYTTATCKAYWRK
ncbi:lactococcin 972 family bacteriocin [Amycolatopsis japonica]|uniref:lactococcin 972 family bacteriocin n=1 Tax=Amycolatopsis japonica TaxID=208439 RepID=UPI003671EF9C